MICLDTIVKNYGQQFFLFDLFELFRIEFKNKFKYIDVCFHFLSF